MDYYSDPEIQRALNERWWREYRDRSHVRYITRETRMEKAINGFNKQSPEEVTAALERAKTESGVVPLPPVVEPKAQYATRDGSPTSVRNYSTVMRQLILDGLSNAEVFAECVVEFGPEEMPESKKNYPAWYRGQLSKEGLLPKELATNNLKNKGMMDMASPAVMPRSVGSIMTQIESQLKYMQDLIEKYELEQDAITKMQVGLGAAHKAFCESVQEDPETYVSPMTERLQQNESRTVFLMKELVNNSLECKALDAALEAYMGVVAPPEEDEKDPDDAPPPPEEPTPPAPPAPPAQAKKKSGGRK